MSMSQISPSNPFAVIIPVSNRLAFTKLCLKAFLKHTDFSLVRSVTIYDNNSEDGSFEYAKSLGLNIIRGNFPNANCCINVFLKDNRNSNIKYLVKLDNDIVVKRDWLSICNTYLITNPNTGTLFFCKRDQTVITSNSSIHGGNWIIPFFLIKRFGYFPDKGRYPGCHKFHYFAKSLGFNLCSYPGIAIDLTFLSEYSELVRHYNKKGYMLSRG